MNEEGTEKPIKIVIMGMDNAGKSTIVNLLSEDAKCPSEPPEMTPTKGIHKEFITLFDRTTVIWDFGGQEIYRNKYLQVPKKSFHSIDFFFYVVDVQDYIRMFSSAMYFKGVFQLIRKHSPDAKLIFLFHKMDPNFKPGEKNVKEQFMKDIRPFIGPSHIKYSTYNTTIYDVNNIKHVFEEEVCN